MASVTDPGQSQCGLSSSSVNTTASSSSGGGGRSRRAARDRRAMSMVEDLGVYDSACGYCKARTPNFRSRGLWAHTLSVQDYEDLLDRGWRRSGMFLYKPCMKETCCPPYTIRLKVDSFVAAKDQMRVLRRMQRYVDGDYNGPQTVGELHEEKDDVDERNTGVPSDLVMASSSERTSDVEQRPGEARQMTMSDGVKSEEEKLIAGLKDAIEASVTKCAEKGILPPNLEIPQVSVKPISRKVKSKLSAESVADYTSNIAFPLAANVKRRKKADLEGAENSNTQQGRSLCWTPEAIAENLVVVLSELCPLGVSSVKACKAHLNFLLSNDNMLSPKIPEVESQVSEPNGEFTVSKHPVKPVKSTSNGSTRQLEIRMSRSSFDEEEFALYKKYQIHVHNERPEDVRDSSYRKFLVDSPLVFVPPANNGTTPSCGFGSFHQQYLVDGKLIAVGVVDILPHCLSSKYLFWDPDFAFLSLGKYSVLQEIQWVQKEQKLCPSLQYYYLGFYIHSCPKMRYKAAYYPSELLCPERYRWVSYEVALPALDEQAYVCLSNVGTVTSAPANAGLSGKPRREQRAGARDNNNERYSNGVEVDEARHEVVQYQEERKSVVEEDGAQPVIDISAILGEILLFLQGTYLPFKHLRAIRTIPRQQLDAIASNLHKYLQDVGPTLATRMAYALS